MWDNLCRHVDRLVAARHTCLVEPATAAAPRDDGAHCSGELAGRAVLDQRHTTRSERTRWRFCEIHALSVQGLSMPMIARRLRLNFKTVRRYLRADSVEQLVAGGVRASKLYPFKPYLHQRLTASVRSATALHAQIVTQGYTGIYNIVERYLKPMRRTDAATLAQVLRNRPSPVRQVTAWITGLPGHLDTGFEEAVTQSECLDAASTHPGRCPHGDERCAATGWY